MKETATLYISDLDGTLLNKDAKLSDYTTNSINAIIEKGLNFSVATARSLAAAQKMLQNLKLSIPIILLNGVLIYDMNQKCYIKINRLLPDVVVRIIEAIRSFEITAFMYELKDDVDLRIYHEVSNDKPVHDYLKERMAKYSSTQPAGGLSGVSPDNVIYFTLIDTYERLQLVYDYFSKEPGLSQTLYKNVYNPKFWFLEVFSEKASKQCAVNYLKEMCKFDRVVGFGDNYNDLSLFAACDVRVAVENATQNLKEASTHICASNDDDGVAKWLEENYGKGEI